MLATQGRQDEHNETPNPRKHTAYTEGKATQGTMAKLNAKVREEMKRVLRGEDGFAACRGHALL